MPKHPKIQLISTLYLQIVLSIYQPFLYWGCFTVLLSLAYPANLSHFTLNNCLSLYWNTDHDTFPSLWIKCSVVYNLVIEFLFTITYISNSHQSEPMYCSSFDMLVVLNRHAMQTSTISYQLVYWTNKLVEVNGMMHWRVGWCVKSTCWLTFTKWCIDLLVVLNKHVGWHLLMHWSVGWCVG